MDESIYNEEMAKTKIFLLTTDLELIQKLKSELVEVGYEVLEHTSSKYELSDMLEIIAKIKPDVILLDIYLKSDSLQLAETIKITFALPIIYLCSHVSMELINRIRDFEPYGYIFYPYRSTEIVTAIEMALDRYKSEQWVNSILASLTEGVMAFDMSGRIKYINPLARHYLELNGHEDVLNHAFEDVMPATLRELIADYKHIFQQPLEQAEPGPAADKILELPDYTHHDSIISIKAIFIRNLKGNGWLLLFRDITERKKAEMNLDQAFSKLRRTLGGIIEAINLTVEYRDPYTAGHQRKVSYLARAMGKELGLPEERVEGLRIASIIHDLGKLYIPVEILIKPSRLTHIEFELIKQHPQTAYNILKSIEFPWPIADIVKQHHERIDGSGYPLGLTGEQIIEEARILAVADVIEAMTSSRPYRPALGWDKAIKEVVLNKGILYDARVVEAYLTLIQTGDFY